MEQQTRLFFSYNNLTKYSGTARQSLFHKNTQINTLKIKHGALQDDRRGPEERGESRVISSSPLRNTHRSDEAVKRQNQFKKRSRPWKTSSCGTVQCDTCTDGGVSIDPAPAPASSGSEASSSAAPEAATLLCSPTNKQTLLSHTMYRLPPTGTTMHNNAAHEQPGRQCQLASALLADIGQISKPHHNLPCLVNDFPSTQKEHCFGYSHTFVSQQK